MAGVLLLLSTDFQGGGGYLTAHARLDQLALGEVGAICFSTYL